MPYVKIEVTREGVTREQKQALIKGVTDLMSDVLNKDPQWRSDQYRHTPGRPCACRSTNIRVNTIAPGTIRTMKTAS